MPETLPECPWYTTPDVLIVGSGPVGATFARLLLDHGDPSLKVAMVEMGARDSDAPGDNKKNAMQFQLNIDRFVHVIQGDLATLSIPVGPHGHFATLHPQSFRPPKDKPYIQNGRNPNQNPHLNLEGSAVTRCVGGMATHWTCAIPEQHKDLERYPLYSDDEEDSNEWKRLYKHAKKLIGYDEGKAFEDYSVRHRLVKHILHTTRFPDQNGEFPGPNREFPPLPLGVRRRKDNDRFVTWSSAATIMNYDGSRERFILLPQHICRKLVYEHPKNDPDNYEITEAHVENFFPCDGKKNIIKIRPKLAVVVCAGAVPTTQLLFNSGINKYLPALGRNLMEQTMAFCQVVLKEDHVKKVRDVVDDPSQDWLPKGLVDKVREHIETTPHDPLPFPSFDPEPNLMSPVAQGREWHGQVHRDAFSYGEVAEYIDSRVVVDLRWFGIVKPNWNNRVTFDTSENGIKDSFQMPQPTFEFRLGESDKAVAGRMMEDMINVAHSLGGFVRGSEPQFLKPGLALHITGTTSVGTDPEKSVVNDKGKVHKFKNLYVGGCGVLPKENACNPTLTAICFAIRGVEDILGKVIPS